MKLALSFICLLASVESSELASTLSPLELQLLQRIRDYKGPVVLDGSAKDILSNIAPNTYPTSRQRAWISKSIVELRAANEHEFAQLFFDVFTKRRNFVWRDIRQVPVEFVPFFPSKPWWRPEDFVLSQTLKLHFDEILREFRSLMEIRSEFSKQQYENINLIGKGAWKEFALYQSLPPDEHGREQPKGWYVGNCLMVPFLCGMLFAEETESNIIKGQVRSL